MTSRTSDTERAATARNTSQKRIRRTADEARRLILDAAEERLAAQGPEGIRLQDIARDVGISHPAILHHFESREGLVRALIHRTSTQFRDKMLALVEDTINGGAGSEGLIQNAYQVLSDRGSARLLAWLILTGRAIENSSSQDLTREIADALHGRRVELAKERGRPAPAREDTVFMSMLTSTAAFGDAIIGRQIAAASGLDPEALARYRKWLANLLDEHVAVSDRK